MTTSLRGRLSLSINALLAVLWVIVFASVMWVVDHETDEIFDAGLQEASQRLLSLSMRDPDLLRGVTVEVPDVGEHEEYLVYQVFDDKGTMLLRSHHAPMTPLPVPRQHGFHVVGDQHFNVEKTRDGRFTVVTAERAGHRSDTRLSIARYLLIPLLALLPLAWLAIHWSIRVSQRPVDRFADEVARRGEGNLTPVGTEGLPDELRGIGQSTNQLIERLRLALEAERRFSANCAHELRTPLAAAMAQLQRVEAETETSGLKARIASSREMLERLRQRSERLLQLARAEAGIGLGSDRVDLGAVVSMVLRDHALLRRRPTRIDAPEEAVHAVGDIDAIGIALQNLIDNAERYGTPNTPIVVTIGRDATVSVENDCEPIAPEVLETLKQRFVRAERDRSGSGIGLWIVETIARHSGGGLTLQSPCHPNGRGFRATLTLKRAASPHAQ